MNPFITGGPIRDPKDFKGRRDVLRVIIDRCIKRQNVSVHGERRTGKTSLLLYLANPESYIELPDYHVPVFFDFQGFSTASVTEIWQSIGSAIVEQTEQRTENWPIDSIDSRFGTKRQLFELDRKFGSTENLRGLLRALKKLGISIHLLLDEFEATNHNPNLGPDFYSHLRGLYNESYNLTYVISTRTGLADVELAQPFIRDRFSSPFFNIFITQFLGPLELSDADELINDYIGKNGLDITLAERLLSEMPFLYEHSGFHPFFLQLLCYHLLNHRDRPGWPRGVAQREALASFEKDAYPHFQFYWERSGQMEKQLIEELAFEGTIDWSRAIVGAARDRLGNRALLVPGTEPDGRWRLFSSTFAQWVVSRYQSPTDYSGRNDISQLADESRQWLQTNHEEALRMLATELDLVGNRIPVEAEQRGTLNRSAASRLLLSEFDYVINLLFEALQDTRVEVRAKAAGALGKWGDERSIAPLAQKIQDPSRDVSVPVRRACVGALGLIGGPTAVRALIEAAQHDPEEVVRRDAIIELRSLAYLSVSSRSSPVSSFMPIHGRVWGSEEQVLLRTMRNISQNPDETHTLREEAQMVVEFLGANIEE